MKDERENIEEVLRDRGESLLWIDLKGFGDEDRLLRKSFESDAFKEWIWGDHVLHMFLDSLDECRLRVPHVAALFLEQFREVREHISRLRLRVACRTAEWPSQLEEGLPELWGEEKVGVFELVPLRKHDVKLAAEVEGIDSEAFLAEVDHKSAQPLAIKPVTLRFLINLYRRNGRFPARQPDLYHEGCQLLVTETSQSRADSRQIGKLNPGHRLAIAARIAAVSMFCNKPAIYVGSDPGEATAEDVRLQELCGSTETIDGVECPVSEEQIHEVLATGLFSGRGPYRLGFAHQSYAEFLAAWYLKVRGLEAKQILSLIRPSGQPSVAVVPQLAETAAWLTEMNTEVFQEILRSDPQILLRSDVAQASPQDREALVRGLLELFLARELADDWDLRDGYRRLQHPGLSQQLVPYLRLGPEAWLVRRAAIDIAESCKLTDLLDLLLQIALDSQDFQPTRVEAAKAIATIGSREARQQLLPLALGVAEDSNDELKGTALRTLWPGLLTAKELFGVLTPIKDQRLIGSYHDLLDRHLLDHLEDRDLPEALAWVEGKPAERGMRSPLQSLAEEVLLRAFQRANEPGIRRPLVNALLARADKSDRLRDPEAVARAEAVLGDSVRRQIAEEIMEWEDDFGRKRLCLLFDQPRLVRFEDLDWILSRLREARTGRSANEWAQLALSIFYPEHPGHADKILAEALINPLLAQTFKGFLGTVALGSREAAELRDHFEMCSPPAELKSTATLRTPPPQKRIEACLSFFEQGELDSWWRLAREMTREATSAYYGSDLEPLLIKLPGWKNSDENIRRRILNAAWFYLLQREPVPKRWFGKNILFRPDFAAYKALCILAAEEPTRLDDLPAEVWERWMPVILGYPLSTPNEVDAAVHKAVVARAYQRSPEAFLRFLNRVVNLENRRNDHLEILRRLGDCWDERLMAAFCKKARQPTLKAGALRNLLEELFRRGSAEVDRLSRSLIKVPVPKEPRRRARACAAALALLEHASDAGWHTLKPALEADPGWSREVFDGLGFYHEHAGTIGRRLKEAEVADLYLWLAREYPQRQDPDLGAAGWIGPREGIAFFRDGLLSHLRDRGTPAACRELERIVQNLPELDHLKFYLLAARQNMLRQTWVPLSPVALLQFSRHPGTRLVRNADQLLEVILESLDRLQQRLQGKPPMAPYLWNGTRPKDEEALSDWIKLHLDLELQATGIVTLREVQVERGEKTDLHITALVPGLERDTWEPVSAIIEVKGSWHREVKTAMKKQLVETYLRNGDCQRGLYLVGWYHCDAWDPGDYRAKANKDWTWSIAEQELAEQAKSLSCAGRTIRSFLLDVTLRDKAPTAQ